MNFLKASSPFSCTLVCPPTPRASHYFSPPTHLISQPNQQGDQTSSPTSAPQAQADSIATRREHEMAMRTALSSLPARLRAPAAPASAAATGGLRLLSDGKGRVLSEEERAKESVYIQVQTLNPEPLPLTISPIPSLRLR